MAVIYPDEKKKQVEISLNNLQDLSVSRSSSRLTWGIPVPRDSSQTVSCYLVGDGGRGLLQIKGYEGITSEQNTVIMV